MKKLITLLIALAAPVAADEVETLASAGGAITEILFELGAGDRVIAVDTTSIYPESVKELPSLGYVRGLSAEGVLATGADLLIGTHDMGPPAVMENIEAAGMRVEYAPAGEGAGRYGAKVAFVGGVLGLEARAAELVAAYDAQMAEITARRDAMERKPRVLMILSVRDGTPIAAGHGTTGGDMIEITGGENVAVGFEGWKPMTAEAVIAAQPEIILLSTAHVERMGGAEAVMSLPSILSTPAGQSQTYLMLNAQKMLQFGPRSPEAMADIQAAYATIPE